MKNKLILIIIMLSILNIGLSKTPIHDKMDPRIKGKSFGGTLDDNQAAEDGIGIISIQHHTGTTDINNELIVQKILSDIERNEVDITKTTNILDNLSSSQLEKINKIMYPEGIKLDLSVPTSGNGITQYGIVYCNDASPYTTTVINGNTYFVAADLNNLKSNLSYFGGSYPANRICTTKVTSLRLLFLNMGTFNDDVSSWDTSNVTNMDYTFYGNSVFNQDISKWNFSKVTSMTQFLYNALVFNQDVSQWDVSNVVDMSKVFRNTNAANFNPDVSGWNVSNVQNMQWLFWGLQKFNQDLSKWNTSNVTNMNGMFSGTSFNGDISMWNTSKVTDMSVMFSNNSTFNQDISSWDTSKVTSFSQMFFHATSFNQNISKWDLSSVRNGGNIYGVYYMFYGASSFSQDLSGWTSYLNGIPNLVTGGFSSLSGGVIDPTW